jgi:hypothetical protein
MSMHCCERRISEKLEGETYVESAEIRRSREKNHPYDLWSRVWTESTEDDTDSSEAVAKQTVTRTLL